ncbi:MAG: hypothetical protein JJU29_13730 [Verrucomicrobia bacterium]|nr:hypothetical protein [Verrucomicrobiota bacterium]MCH8512728.1 hypothetical protein [Kiritimatiellia bacterium]
MKTLTIRNIPDETYTKLGQEARRNHRSMQEQLRLILEREAEFAQPCVCEQATAYRSRLENRTHAQTIPEEIREDRER